MIPCAKGRKVCTKNDFVRLLSIKPDDITVMPLAASDNFYQEKDDKKIKIVLKKYNIPIRKPRKVKTSFGTVTVIDIPCDKAVLKRLGIVSDCRDIKFIQLVEEENYEKLYNDYSIDDIIHYSLDKKRPIGSRRK